MKIISKFLMIILLIVLLVPAVLMAQSITWSPNEDATKFVVEYREAGTTNYQILGETTLLSYPIPATFDKKKTWEFVVRAVNDCGNSSDLSDVVTWRECDATFPRKCTNVQVVKDPVGN